MDVSLFGSVTVRWTHRKRTASTRRWGMNDRPERTDWRSHQLMGAAPLGPAVSRIAPESGGERSSARGVGRRRSWPLPSQLVHVFSGRVLGTCSNEAAADRLLYRAVVSPGQSSLVALSHAHVSVHPSLPAVASCGPRAICVPPVVAGCGGSRAGRAARAAVTTSLCWRAAVMA